MSLYKDHCVPVLNSRAFALLVNDAQIAIYMITCYGTSSTLNICCATIVQLLCSLATKMPNEMSVDVANKLQQASAEMDLPNGPCFGKEFAPYLLALDEKVEDA